VFTERTQALAFTTVADRDTWVRRWTANLCSGANSGGRTLLYGTMWVLTPMSGTGKDARILAIQTVTPDVAALVAPAVHGSMHWQSCEPENPPAIQTTITDAEGTAAKLDAGGVDCGPLTVPLDSPIYGAANAMVDPPEQNPKPGTVPQGGRLRGLFFQCSHTPRVQVTQMQSDLASKLAADLQSRTKATLCGASPDTKFVNSASSIVTTTDAALASKVADALPGSSTSSC
jgi:hypothetical protein